MRGQSADIAATILSSPKAAMAKRSFGKKLHKVNA